MIDPTPGTAPLGEPLTDAEREARIEQLLVAGLDEYFAGRFDHAVNVWTRVLFLDRTSDRAKAYIDRARRAFAERQREADALVHEGLRAFDTGEVERARDMLTAAIDRGAPHEQVLPVLHRIGRLDVTTGAMSPHAPSERRRGPAVDHSVTWSSWLPWAVALAVVVLSIGVLVVSDGASVTAAVAPAGLDGPRGSLPVPSPAEAHVRRARRLFDAGKLPDALAVLDRVALGSPTYGEAQALRARIQSELLRVAEPGGGAERQP